ncbi:Xenotropic and polytropic retrovirus receptor like protein [Argiope bruennichi]|uniref:Xenotropic and polytropic retrovirus receptor like protein n=1 Tax=Argiope bruennichi TaxID=94029 RepID=A0A8T0FDU2_ARGBR|nr:Xenotropic and polytropic retrovirus receptor like protein [Argiope bruennichi]
MKFAEHLAAHITPEWRKQYIQYEEMKSMLYSGVERAPSPEGTDAGAKWRQQWVDVAPFYVNKDIDKLIHDTENIVTRYLEGGDRQKAMKRLRVPPLNDQAKGDSVLLINSCSIFTNAPDNWRIAVRLYRGSLLIILFLFLIGVNVYGWRTSGVNHVLIFELDPRNHLSEQHLMEIAAIFSVMWALSVLAFLFSDALSIPAYANPLLLVVLLFAFLFNPTRTLQHHARFWLLRVLGRIIAAPFFHVGFADFWLADQLNSLVPVLVDFQYFICFYVTSVNWEVNTDSNKCVDDVGLISRPIVACLPAWFRFAQCLRRYRDTKEAFPHLVNAGKYSTTFFNVIFSSLYVYTKDNYGSTWENPFFYLWIVFGFISSIYTYIWDIKMDWGLFDENTGENRFLREEIVYSSPNYYYFAIVEDLVLRFGWTLSVSLTEMGLIHADIMSSVLAPLEVIRRFVWNFFRLENEHLNNCGKFRAVRDISVAPLDSSDQTLLLCMMDEPDGVINRRKKERKYPNRRKKSDTRILLDDNETDDPDI